MINFFRSLFGYGRPSGYRMVAGAPAAPGAKDAAYVRNSNRRVNTLQELYMKYKNTPHAEKLKEVLEKTKKIHMYLLAKKRVHELEMFHMQHTDHFINTFSVIVEVYQRHASPVRVAVPALDAAPPPPPPAKQQVQRQQQKPIVESNPANRPFEEKVEDVLRKIEEETIRGLHTAHKVTEMVKRVAGQAPNTAPPTEKLRAGAPALSLPTIAIDTYSRIYYVREQEGGEAVRGEIGFTSTDEEKDAFITHVALRLGIDKEILSYMGNTVLTIPEGPTAYMPVLYWKDCAYAISMHDYRLFPVKSYRRSR